MKHISLLIKYNTNRFLGFIAILTITLSITIIFSSLVLSIVNATKFIKTSEHKLIEITVMPGDTLWSIAKSYAAPETDLRFIIDKIIYENNLSDSTIWPGQVLKFQIPYAE